VAKREGVESGWRGRKSVREMKHEPSSSLFASVVKGKKTAASDALSFLLSRVSLLARIALR